MADKVTNEEIVETVETPVTETVEAPKRRRRTKAEIEAEAAAKAEAGSENAVEPETEKSKVKDNSTETEEANKVEDLKVEEPTKDEKSNEAPAVEEIKKIEPTIIEDKPIDLDPKEDNTVKETENYHGIIQSPAGIKFYRCPTGERGLLGKIKYRIYIDGQTVGDYVTAHAVFPGTGIVSGYVHKDSIPSK